jgi:hypothetical protein
MQSWSWRKRKSTCTSGWRVWIRDDARQSRRQILRGVLKSDNREHLSIPAIKESEHPKTGHGHAENVGEFQSLKTSEMAALRLLQQLMDKFLNGSNKSDGNLLAAILDGNPIAVMAHSPVKGGMDLKFVNAHRR